MIDLSVDDKATIAKQAPIFHNEGLISYNEMINRVIDHPIKDLTF